MKWIIYKHTNLINGKVYIGQTRKTTKERWRNGKAYISNPNTRFAQAILKYGWASFQHEILETDIDNQIMANERERFWINQNDSYNFDKGYNMTLGGSDIPVEYSIRARESKRKKKREEFDFIFCWELTKLFPNPTIALEWFVSNGYENNYKHTNPLLRVIDKENRTCFGFHFCRLIRVLEFKPTNKEETNANKGSRKKIICVNTGDVYDSLSDCGRILNIKTQHLSKACKRHSPTHKLYFAYLDEYDESIWEKYISEKKTPETAKPVYCFELDKQWDSITSCCRELNISTGEMSRLLKEQSVNNIYKTISGKHFCLLNQKNDAKLGGKPIRKDSRAVCCIETSKKYRSVTEAEKELHIKNVLKCCKNWRYTAGGFHWCFVKDIDNYCSIEQKKRGLRNGLAKKVRCVETGEVFDTQSQAGRKYHRDVKAISRAIQSGRMCAGYHWEYAF